MRGEQHLDLARIVLPVAVDLQAEIVAMARGIFEAGLHRAADAEILRETRNRRAVACDRGGRVRRAVVDHQRVVAATGLRDLGKETADRGFLVVAGDDQQDARRVCLQRGITAAGRVGRTQAYVGQGRPFSRESSPCYTCRCISCTGGGPFPSSASPPSRTRMRAAKLIFSIVFLAILASNIRLISYWSESRGVYDDICYLRQAHLFQRFGWWSGLDTSLDRENDGYLTAKLRSIDFPNWNELTRAPCHMEAAGGKWVMTPPPGTGFVLSLFPEGSQVIRLYVLANAIIASFALYALWRARQPPAVTLAAVFGALSIYFMMNPTKASYSMAPTMVVCAVAGLLTARLFTSEGRSHF